jgi:pimeloyl-ACP methyl ester carboxylesterase
MVQWDQRGAGRTLRKSGPTVAPTITVDRMVQDGIEVTEYLRKHLGKEKIVIVAHSFGSILGLRMAKARPDLFYAYVGTGQVADSTRSSSVAYDALLKKAKAIDDQRAVAELSHIGPPPYESGDGFCVQHKWANAFEGADEFLYGTIGLTLVAPGGSVQDINDSVARTRRPPPEKSPEMERTRSETLKLFVVSDVGRRSTLLSSARSERWWQSSWPRSDVPSPAGCPWSAMRCRTPETDPVCSRLRWPHP